MPAVWVRPNGLVSESAMLMRYLTWANALTVMDLTTVDAAELTRKRPTTFKTILSTLNHIWVVEDIFRAHFEGRNHGYTQRNTDQTPSLAELQESLNEMDSWLVAFADGLDDKDLATEINFEFVGGGAGRMSRSAILNHLAIHASYHRGFIGDMMYQIPATPSANDLPVFLRDVWYV